MMIVPLGVSICLYTGISRRIESLKSTMSLHDEGIVEITPKSIKQDYKMIEEAIGFYVEHCALSFVHLEQQFEPVKERYHNFLMAHFQEDL
ncbi:hypothetical protein [Brevibacillus sp. NRS-1366]|uniref:hypothetical protein n=1 Tax=Brevibacillus sp. NRS-1366 TaxID=3233899 RepID=UPI003D243F44